MSKDVSYCCDVFDFLCDSSYSLFVLFVVVYV